MTTPPRRAARHLSDLFARHAAAARPDADLLDRFVRDRDGAAFAELVRRHGPAVLGAARRATRDRHDAEDVFQATFLVLARKAGAVRRGEAVGGWLFATATRLAARVRADRRRRDGEDPSGLPAPPLADGPDADLRAVLDAELARLPARYRAALVLCYLNGKTRAEAAADLGCTPGSVKKCLERGRDLLRGRLVRRGVTAPGGVLVLGLLAGEATAAVPRALSDGTARAAVLFAAGPVSAGAVPSAVLTLATGGLKAMMWAKLKLCGAGVAALGLCVGGGSAAWPQAGGAGPAVAALAGEGQQGGVTAGPAAGADAKRAELLRKQLAELEAQMAAAAQADARAATKTPPDLDEQIRALEKELERLRAKKLVAGQADPEALAAMAAVLEDAMAYHARVNPPAKSTSPDGKLVATVQDGKVRVTEAATGKLLWEAAAPAGAVPRWSPDGKTLTAAPLLDAATGKTVSAGQSLPLGRLADLNRKPATDPRTPEARKLAEDAAALKRQLDALQKRIDELTKQGGRP